MDKFSAARLHKVQQLKTRIEQIRDQVEDTPIPWTRIKPSSKPKRASKPMYTLPFPKHWTSGRHLNAEQRKYIKDNILRIRGKCAEICREIKWAESYTYAERVRVLSVIEKEIEEVIRDNKHTFGYDREVQFQEETISQYAEEMAHKLFTKAIEMGNIRFDEELPGYVDECGMQIDEYGFKLRKLWREAAKVELLEEYNAAYKAGYNCDGYISTVIERCELLKNSIRVRRDFLSKISCPDANEPTAASFTAYLQIEDKDSIINKLRRLPIDLPTKMYGAIITALIANGTMRPIADGERGAIYRALRDIYNDRRNIGTRQGVTKYICTDLISPLDIESANSYLQ